MRGYYRVKVDGCDTETCIYNNNDNGKCNACENDGRLIVWGLCKREKGEDDDFKEHLGKVIANHRGRMKGKTLDLIAKIINDAVDLEDGLLR